MSTIITSNKNISSVKSFIEYAHSLPFTTIETDEKRKRTFKEVAAECECVSVDVFIDELKASVNEYFENASSSCN